MTFWDTLLAVFLIATLLLLVGLLVEVLRHLFMALRHFIGGDVTEGVTSLLTATLAAFVMTLLSLAASSLIS